MSIERALDWRDRQVSAGEAVSVVQPGDTVFVGSACATPRCLLEALEQLGLPGVPLVHFLTAVAEQIARYAARLIEDRSTLQVGLGRVPNEMLAHLTNRRNLAIHSDVITEPIVDLVSAGVITGPISTSWAMGSRRLYDLVDGDPRF